MNHSIETISLYNLAIAFIPVLVVVAVFIKWSLSAAHTLYAVARMLGQLLLVGYVLAFVFDSDSAWLVFGILVMMVAFSSWIALGVIKEHRRVLIKSSLASILIGGGFTLLVISQGVINLEPWYMPRYMIPLAGMIFANSMNSVSLAAERFSSELARGERLEDARNAAFTASLIPITNSLFAVGLVSLPGMMTGQILSGVSPLIAARYQIMVMCMIFSATGISSACFLVLSQSQSTQKLNLNNNKEN